MSISILILIILYKVFSTIEAIFPSIKSLNPLQAPILATVILSATIATFPAISSLLTKKTFQIALIRLCILF